MTHLRDGLQGEPFGIYRTEQSATAPPDESRVSRGCVNRPEKRREAERERLGLVSAHDECCETDR